MTSKQSLANGLAAFNAHLRARYPDNTEVEEILQSFLDTDEAVEATCYALSRLYSSPAASAHVYWLFESNLLQSLSQHATEPVAGFLLKLNPLLRSHERVTVLDRFRLAETTWSRVETGVGADLRPVYFKLIGSDNILPTSLKLIVALIRTYVLPAVGLPVEEVPDHVPLVAFALENMSRILENPENHTRAVLEAAEQVARFAMRFLQEDSFHTDLVMRTLEFVSFGYHCLVRERRGLRESVYLVFESGVAPLEAYKAIHTFLVSEAGDEFSGTELGKLLGYVLEVSSSLESCQEVMPLVLESFKALYQFSRHRYSSFTLSSRQTRQLTKIVAFCTQPLVKMQNSHVKVLFFIVKVLVQSLTKDEAKQLLLDCLMLLDQKETVEFFLTCDYSMEPFCGLVDLFAGPVTTWFAEACDRLQRTDDKKEPILCDEIFTRKLKLFSLVLKHASKRVVLGAVHENTVGYLISQLPELMPYDIKVVLRMLVLLSLTKPIANRENLDILSSVLDSKLSFLTRAIVLMILKNAVQLERSLDFLFDHETIIPRIIGLNQVEKSVCALIVLILLKVSPAKRDRLFEALLELDILSRVVKPGLLTKATESLAIDLLMVLVIPTRTHAEIISLGVFSHLIKRFIHAGFPLRLQISHVVLNFLYTKHHTKHTQELGHILDCGGANLFPEMLADVNPNQMSHSVLVKRQAYIKNLFAIFKKLGSPTINKKYGKAMVELGVYLLQKKRQLELSRLATIEILESLFSLKGSDGLLIPQMYEQKCFIELGVLLQETINSKSSKHRSQILEALQCLVVSYTIDCRAELLVLVRSFFMESTVALLRERGLSDTIKRNFWYCLQGMIPFGVESTSEYATKIFEAFEQIPDYKEIILEDHLFSQNRDISYNVICFLLHVLRVNPHYASYIANVLGVGGCIEELRQHVQNDKLALFYLNNVEEYL